MWFMRKGPGDDEEENRRRVGKKVHKTAGFHDESSAVANDWAVGNAGQQQQQQQPSHHQSAQNHHQNMMMNYSRMMMPHHPSMFPTPYHHHMMLGATSSNPPQSGVAVYPFPPRVAYPNAVLTHQQSTSSNNEQSQSNAKQTNDQSSNNNEAPNDKPRSNINSSSHSDNRAHGAAAGSSPPTGSTGFGGSGTNGGVSSGLNSSPPTSATNAASAYPYYQQQQQQQQQQQMMHMMHQTRMAAYGGGGMPPGGYYPPPFAGMPGVMPDMRSMGPPPGGFFRSSSPSGYGPLTGTPYMSGGSQPTSMQQKQLDHFHGMPPVSAGVQPGQPPSPRMLMLRAQKLAERQQQQQQLQQQQPVTTNAQQQPNPQQQTFSLPQTATTTVSSSQTPTVQNAVSSSNNNPPQHSSTSTSNGTVLRQQNSDLPVEPSSAPTPIQQQQFLNNSTFSQQQYAHEQTPQTSQQQTVPLQNNNASRPPVITQRPSMLTCVGEIGRQFGFSFFAAPPQMPGINLLESRAYATTSSNNSTQPPYQTFSLTQQQQQSNSTALTGQQRPNGQIPQQMNQPFGQNAQYPVQSNMRPTSRPPTLQLQEALQRQQQQQQQQKMMLQNRRMVRSVYGGSSNPLHHQASLPMMMHHQQQQQQHYQQPPTGNYPIGPQSMPIRQQHPPPMQRWNTTNGAPMSNENVVAELEARNREMLQELGRLHSQQHMYRSQLNLSSNEYDSLPHAQRNTASVNLGGSAKYQPYAANNQNNFANHSAPYATLTGGAAGQRSRSLTRADSTAALTPSALAELRALRQRKAELETHMATLHYSRKNLMNQLELWMLRLRTQSPLTRGLQHGNQYYPGKQTATASALATPLRNSARLSPTATAAADGDDELATLIKLQQQKPQRSGRNNQIDDYLRQSHSRSSTLPRGFGSARLPSQANNAQQVNSNNNSGSTDPQKLQADLLNAADSVTSAMTSLVREMNYESSR